MSTFNRISAHMLENGAQSVWFDKDFVWLVSGPLNIRRMRMNLFDLGLFSITKCGDIIINLLGKDKDVVHRLMTVHDRVDPSKWREEIAAMAQREARRLPYITIKNLDGMNCDWNEQQVVEAVTAQGSIYDCLPDHEYMDGFVVHRYGNNPPKADVAHNCGNPKCPGEWSLHCRRALK